jgi:ubiquitin-protein ligase
VGGKFPRGVYISPSSESIFGKVFSYKYHSNFTVWNCVIFIRQGIYKNAIFRFNLEIPEIYPQQRPTIIFLTPVFHPLISEEGVLDLELPYPQWSSDKNFLWQPICYVKKIFYKFPAIPPTLSTGNPKAQDLYHPSPMSIPNSTFLSSTE